MQISRVIVVGMALLFAAVTSGAWAADKPRIKAKDPAIQKSYKSPGVKIKKKDVKVIPIPIPDPARKKAQSTKKLNKTGGKEALPEPLPLPRPAQKNKKSVSQQGNQ